MKNKIWKIALLNQIYSNFLYRLVIYVLEECTSSSDIFSQLLSRIQLGSKNTHKNHIHKLLTSIKKWSLLLMTYNFLCSQFAFIIKCPKGNNNTKIYITHSRFWIQKTHVVRPRNYSSYEPKWKFFWPFMMPQVIWGAHLNIHRELTNFI